jgi:GNAT superfamily N-acetyltransferase
LSTLSYRWAVAADCAELARLNQQLVREGADFGPDDFSFLHERLQAWLDSGAYRAVLFTDASGRTAAYALFRESADEIYLAQFLVLPHARRHGLGQAAVDCLRREIWRPGKRLILDVLVHNRAALEFWHRLGWRDCVLVLEIPVVPGADSAVRPPAPRAATADTARQAASA